MFPGLLHFRSFALCSVTQPGSAKLVISVLPCLPSPAWLRLISAFLHLPSVGSHPYLLRAILLEGGRWVGRARPAGPSDLMSPYQTSHLPLVMIQKQRKLDLSTYVLAGVWGRVTVAAV